MTYDKWLAFDHHVILRIKNLCFGLGLGILLNNWTSPVVCVTPGRDRVAGKDLWTHFFQEVQKSLSSAPRCERETIRPYPGGCMVLWVYRDVGQNQEPIRTQYFKWSQNYESDPRSLPLIELETRVREVFTITDVAFSLLLVESASSTFTIRNLFKTLC